MRSLSFLALLLPLALGGCDYGDFYLTLSTPGDGGQSGTGGQAGSGGPGGSDTGGTGGTGGAGATGGTGGQGGEEPFLEGAPKATTSPKDLAFDLFGEDGNRYWFAVDPAQVERMNGKNPGGGFGDIYTPGPGESSTATYVNHLFATNTAEVPATADFGKVEVRVIGQSTFRPWQPDTIPNLRVDMDEFQDDLRLDDTEHFRFNNGLVGSIFREEIALEIYTALGYPAPRATFAWVGSNVWGPDIQIPYTLVETYKKDFCKEHENALGGDCVNMWEFVGDISEAKLNGDACQLKTCTTERLAELSDLIAATPPGPGFKAATADYIAWDKVHEFQCLSWMLWTGDDALHNFNNVVLVERDDGKFLYLPYSIDISGGQDWYQNTPLTGQSSVVSGCQADPDCWADLLSTCDTLIAKFTAADTPAMVDATYKRLEDNGMLRGGDEGRYQSLRKWYVQRTADLPGELLDWTTLPCQFPNVDCLGQCIPIDQCTPVCMPDEVQCGAKCAPLGACFDCQFPWQFCLDGSCQAKCPF